MTPVAPMPISPLTVQSSGLAAFGTIALFVDAPGPHGPIAVAMGMHVPLITSLWRAMGVRHGAGGAAMHVSLRILWTILLYAGLCACTLLTLGVAQVLTRGFAFAALGGLGLLLTVWVESRRNHDITQLRPSGKADWIACPLILIGVLAATHALLNPQYDFDMLYYHLFVPAQWAQAGRILIVPIGFGEFAPSYYPYATELYYLSLLIPMGTDHLARGGQILFYVELVAAAVALGREMRMRPAARIAAAGCVALTPALAWQAGTANVDLAFTAHLVAVVLFSIRLARRPIVADGAGLILAIGLAIGTKMLALPFLLALLPLWGRAVISTVQRVRRHDRIRSSEWAALSAAVIGSASVGGYWYARNWLVTGNPLYPLKISMGGVSLFDGVFDRAAMLNSAFNQSRFGWEGLQAVLNELLRMPSWFAAPSYWDASGTSTLGAWLILVAIVAATILSLSYSRFRVRFALPGLSLSILAMLALFWWSVPYQVPRFLWPPLALAIIAFFATMSRLPIAAARAVLGLFAGTWLALSMGEFLPTFVTRIGLVVAAGGILLFWLHSRLMKFRQVVVLGAGVVGIWLAMWHVFHAGDPVRQANHRHTRWRTFGDTWTRIDGLADEHTIAYAGHNIPYFLMGPQLRNRVVYVQAGGEPGWGYHDFARLPEARSLGRPNVTDFAANRLTMDGQLWLRRLAAERVDCVVVSRLYRGPNISHRHDRDAFPIERQWLDTLAQARDRDGRRLASRTILGGGWVLYYGLHLTGDESRWPPLATFEQHETDALDRRRRDGTPPGEEINGYPFAAEAIAEMELDVLR